MKFTLYDSIFNLIFSRNNGYAISTPTHDQYRGDGIGKYTGTFMCVSKIKRINHKML